MAFNGRGNDKGPFGGDKKTGPSPTDRGKQGVKRSLLTEADGIPIGLAIGPANRHDIRLAKKTIDNIVVKRPEPTKKNPQGMCLDKAYDSDPLRDDLREQGFTPHVRSRGEEKIDLENGSGFKARRWVVERTHSWLNRNRRILIRWEKKTRNYKAFLHLACAIICFQASGLFG